MVEVRWKVGCEARGLAKAADARFAKTIPCLAQTRPDLT